MQLRLKFNTLMKRCKLIRRCIFYQSTPECEIHRKHGYNMYCAMLLPFNLKCQDTLHGGTIELIIKSTTFQEVQLNFDYVNYYGRQQHATISTSCESLVQNILLFLNDFCHCRHATTVAMLKEFTSRSTQIKVKSHCDENLPISDRIFQVCAASPCL
jgi:hypothetical protein